MITSRKNQHIVDITKLTQRKHRERQAAFLVEGMETLRMALDAGAHPVEALYCIDQFRGEEPRPTLDRLADAGARLTEVDTHVMESLARRDTPQGLIATFRMFGASLEQVLGDSERQSGLVLVLDRVQDPGNLGSLIRTADAVGARAVVLIEPCVDPFDPKTVGATMGSLFNIPIVRARNVAGLFAQLGGTLTVVGADLRQGAVAWESAALRGPAALVLGNEVQGISEDVRPHVQEWVRLPILGRAESLNVAVAGGALTYLWLEAQQKAAV